MNWLLVLLGCAALYFGFRLVGRILAKMAFRRFVDGQAKQWDEEADTALRQSRPDAAAPPQKPKLPS